MSLIKMAIAFVVNHPAVTSTIIGPRITEQLESQRPAANVVPDEALLDRIDEIVGPGLKRPVVGKGAASVAPDRSAHCCSVSSKALAAGYGRAAVGRPIDPRLVAVGVPNWASSMSRRLWLCSSPPTH